jgi:glycerophosphoryl diester phosphodiesterase
VLNAPDWLVARPIAHRGLHDITQGRVENSIAAAQAAIAKGYSIECDVQVTQDGDAVVFHDFTLDRLTSERGRIDSFTSKHLQSLSYRDTEAKLPLLESFLAAIAGRTPLIIEIKSRFDGDLRLADRVATLLANVSGPVAVKSFDPMILARLRTQRLGCPVGFLGEAHYEHAEWSHLSDEVKAGLSDFSFYPQVRPDFLSWSARDLPHAVPRLCRDGIGLPVMAWTLRSAEERDRIAPFVDQVIFEGFAA